MSFLEIIIILVTLLLNCAFAGFELALATVSLGRLRMLTELKRHGASAALAMKGRMEGSLAVVQIGMTLAAATAAATGGAGANEYLSPWLQRTFGITPQSGDVLAVALVVIPLSAVTIIVAELVPKTLAIKHSEWVCLTLAPVMRVLAYVIYPAVVVCEGATRGIVRLVERLMPASVGGAYEMGLAELRAQARALRTGSIIGAEQEQIILGASNLSRTRVADAMVDAGDVAMLSTDASLADHLVVIHLEAYTRFPVTRTPGDPQGIIGYVNAKEMLFLAKNHPEDPSIVRIVRPLVEVRADVTIGEAFTRMMQEHIHLALVRDAEGKVSGLITIEDILEELVGDIQDEFDRMPRNVTPSGSQWVVGGGATLGALRQATGRADLGADLPDELSLNEWLDRAHPEPFRNGDVILLGGLSLLVRKVRRRKLREALVDVAPAR